MDETIGNQRLSYVYYTYDNYGKFYIGSRLCPRGVSPEEDTKYMGSHSYEGYTPVGKQILLISEDLWLCREFEAFLQFDLISDKNCVNKAVFPLTGNAKLYPTKCPSIRRKLSNLRKSKPMSDKQVEHLARVNAKQKKVGHPMADKNLYPFINTVTGEFFYGTIYDLMDKFGLNSHQARRSKTRHCNSRFKEESSPWALASCLTDGDKFSYETPVSITNGQKVLNGPIRKIVKESGLYLCELYTIVKGKTRRNWKLNDYPERE